MRVASYVSWNARLRGALDATVVGTATADLVATSGAEAVVTRAALSAAILGASRSVRSLAGEIAANAPLTLRAAKLTVDELVRHPEHPHTAELDAAVQACFESADYAEGRRAFLEKRKPVFQGR